MPVHYTRIINGMELNLLPRMTKGSSVEKTKSGWLLSIPRGKNNSYRLAQLENYTNNQRRNLPNYPPLCLRLRARTSDNNLPGTWGFGFWNDPFGFSLGFGGKKTRLPSLPQAAWFMNASPPNWLSFKENEKPDLHSIPANGFFSGTFRSRQFPSVLFIPAVFGLPLLEIRPISKFLRRIAARIIHHDAVPLTINTDEWHEYSIYWLKDGCRFEVDGKEFFTTPLSPHSPLGLVIWIDNQFAAWTPNGRLGYGTLETPDAWLKIEQTVLVTN